MEIIDLDRYGVFNWLHDIVEVNLTRSGFDFYKGDFSAVLSAVRHFMWQLLHCRMSSG